MWTLPFTCRPCPRRSASAAYHIVNEALTNARRHSGGNGARVRVGTTANGSHLTVEVTDDGRGIDVERSSGVGLRSMLGHTTGVGGTFEVTASDQGTTVRAELPLHGGVLG